MTLHSALQTLDEEFTGSYLHAAGPGIPLVELPPSSAICKHILIAFQGLVQALLLHEAFLDHCIQRPTSPGDNALECKVLGFTFSTYKPRNPEQVI